MNNILKKAFSINLGLNFSLKNDFYNNEVNQTDSLSFGVEYIFGRKLKETKHKFL